MATIGYDKMVPRAFFATALVSIEALATCSGSSGWRVWSWYDAPLAGFGAGTKTTPALRAHL